MQNFLKTGDTISKIAYVTKLEDVPGGVTLASTDLTQEYVLEGTPIGVDPATGLYHVVKQAIASAAATNAATDYPVAKGHNFKIGDFFAKNAKAKSATITGINTSNAGYDVISLDSTLGIAINAGDVFFAAGSAVATTSAPAFTPQFTTVGEVRIFKGGNALVGAQRRATLFKSVVQPSQAVIDALAPNILFV